MCALAGYINIGIFHSQIPEYQSGSKFLLQNVQNNTSSSISGFCLGIICLNKEKLPWVHHIFFQLYVSYLVTSIPI